MLNNQLKKPSALLISACLAFTTGLPVAAADSPNQNDWQYGGDIYLWMPVVDGEVRATGQEIDASFSDILDNLNIAIMGGIGAKKDKLMLYTDFFYMDVDDSEKGSINVSPGRHSFTVDGKVSVELEAWVVQPMVAYTVYESPYVSVDLAAGARYLWVDVSSEVKTSDPGINRKYKISGSNDFLDGVFGIRSTINLSDKWDVVVYVDGGGGDSDGTWQGIAGINYQFDKFQGVFGYRYLKWNFDNNVALKDLEISGPYMGAKFAF